MPVHVVGKTCKDDDDRNKEIQKIIVLISETLAQHVRYKLRYICLSSSANNYRRAITTFNVLCTARKLGFALFLIRIKDEVKYNNIFDNTFDAHQKYVKYVTPLHIPLT